MRRPGWRATPTASAANSCCWCRARRRRGAGRQREAQRVLALLLAELPLKQAVKLAAEISGEKKNALYELALQLK